MFNINKHLNDLKVVDQNSLYIEKKNKKMKTLKFYSNFIKNEVVLIDNVIFKFDENGVCEIENVGNVSLAGKLLCQFNPVTDVEPGTEVPIVEEPAKEEVIETKEEVVEVKLEEDVKKPIKANKKKEK